VPNLEMPGLINRFREPERMHKILSDTWIFVSTAVREGLPLTFLEAAAYGCPIISRVDPDEFASRFGKQVHDDDYAVRDSHLLADRPWRKAVQPTTTCERPTKRPRLWRLIKYSTSGLRPDRSGVRLVSPMRPLRSIGNKIHVGESGF
jgi:glycosyltransferase involved in cell wall biosynthesis